MTCNFCACDFVNSVAKHPVAKNQNKYQNQTMKIKPNKLKIWHVALLILVSPTFINGQTETPQISESRLTLNLVTTYEAPGLIPLDSGGRRIDSVLKVFTNEWETRTERASASAGAVFVESKTFIQTMQQTPRLRYGTREFLQELVVEGVIDTIVNWYVAVMYDNTGYPYAIYLRNVASGLPPVRIDVSGSGHLILTEAGKVENRSYYSRNEVKTSGGVTTTKIVANGRKSFSLAMDVKIATAGIDIAGMSKLKYSATAIRNLPSPFWVPNSARTLAVIMSGTRRIQQRDFTFADLDVYVEGSFSLSKGISGSVPAGIIAP